MVYTWQLTWRTDRHLLCLVAIQLQSAQVLQVSFTFRVSVLPTLYVCTILCPTFSVAVNLIKLHKYCFEKENPTHRFIRMNPFPANLVSICGVIFTGISYTYTVYVFRIICTLCSCVLVANLVTTSLDFVPWFIHLVLIIMFTRLSKYSHCTIHLPIVQRHIC